MVSGSPGSDRSRRGEQAARGALAQRLAVDVLECEAEPLLVLADIVEPDRFAPTPPRTKNRATSVAKEQGRTWRGQERGRAGDSGWQVSRAQSCSDGGSATS